VLAGVVAFLHFVRSGRRRDAYLAGVAAGLAACDRQGATGETGAVTPRHERHTRGAAEPDDLLHRGSGRGQYDGEWRLAQMRQRVGLVGQDLQRLTEDRCVTGDPPETIHEPALGHRRSLHGDGTIHGKT